MAGIYDYEGYLEKHGSGTVSRLLGKQKTTWCFLQGPWLYCHQSNNKRSSVVSSIDVSEAQMIRKTTTDKNSAQFEIATKFKTFLFTASTIEECNEWVKRLQKAMTLKDSGTNSTPQKPVQDQPPKSAHVYEEVVPINRQSNVKPINTNHYEDVDKLRSSVPTERHYESVHLDDDVFTRAEKKGLNRSSYNLPTSGPVHYATVTPKEFRKTTAPNNDTIATTETVNNDKENQEDSDESIDDIQSMIPKDFPKLNPQYSLDLADEQPVLDLKAFLHNNNLDRKSYIPNNNNYFEDNNPVQTLKVFMKTLDLT